MGKEDNELYDEMKSLGEVLGFAGSELEAFAGGREGPPVREGFDGVVDVFRGLGLTEAGAKVAAIGHHGDEAEAREVFDAPPVPATRATTTPPAVVAPESQVTRVSPITGKRTTYTPNAAVAAAAAAGLPPGFKLADTPPAKRRQVVGEA